MSRFSLSSRPQCARETAFQIFLCNACDLYNFHPSRLARDDTDLSSWYASQLREKLDALFVCFSVHRRRG